MKTNLVIGLLTLSVLGVQAQNVGINASGANPNSSAVLDLNTGNAGINKGFLVPQVALTATNASAPVSSPATGLIVYNTATAGIAPYNVVPDYYYWNGSVWLLYLTLPPGTAGQVLTSNGGGAPSWAASAGGGSAWGLSGNSTTNPAINYIGTSDTARFVFKQHDTLIGFVDIHDSNVALGMFALKNDIAVGICNAGVRCGVINTAIGNRALQSNTTGSDNTAIGNKDLLDNTTGQVNTALGSYNLISNTSGNYNVAVGTSVLNSNTTGSYNIGISANGCLQPNNGSYNNAIGDQALNSNTTGTNNNAIGYQAMINNTTTGYNVAVGDNAGLASGVDGYGGGGNTYLGAGAGEWLGFATNDIIAGSNTLNTRYNPVSNIARGAGLTVLGCWALPLFHYGNGTIAIGDSSLYTSTTATHDVGLGYACKTLTATDTNEVILCPYCVGAGNNTTTVSGANSKATVIGGGALVVPIQINTATTGTVVATDAQILELDGAASSLQITDPPSPYTGQIWEIHTNQSSISLTWTNSGNFISAPATVTAITSRRFFWNGKYWYN